MTIHSAHNPAYILRMFNAAMFGLRFAATHKLHQGTVYARIQSEAIGFASIG